MRFRFKHLQDFFVDDVSKVVANPVSMRCSTRSTSGTTNPRHRSSSSATAMTRWCRGRRPPRWPGLVRAGCRRRVLDQRRAAAVQQTRRQPRAAVPRRRRTCAAVDRRPVQRAADHPELRAVLGLASLIVIEGLDGAGKRTLTTRLQRAFEPRTLGDHAWRSRATASRSPPTSPARRCTAGTAIWPGRCTPWRSLFALDRGAAADHLAALLRRPRRRHPGPLRRIQRRLQRGAAAVRTRTARWCRGSANWNTAGWACPTPDHQILLDVSVELAAERARRRAGEEPDRARDAYERDDGLQQRTAAGVRRTGRAAAGTDGGRWPRRDVEARPSWWRAPISADARPTAGVCQPGIVAIR